MQTEAGPSMHDFDCQAELLTDNMIAELQEELSDVTGQLIEVK